MCRQIFLLLLMATIMPWLVEAQKSPARKVIKECYVGQPKISVGGSAGEYELGKENCIFPNFACQTKICGDGNDAQDYEKSCGKCVAPIDERGCKCIDCTEELCNQLDNKGPMKQCFVGKFGKFEKEDCKFYKTDGCHTIKCNGGKRAEDYEKSCGKCPAKEELGGCECKECNDGTLCNEKNEDIGSIKQCYDGELGISGKFEKKDCEYYKTDGCQTIVCGDGTPGENYYKSCGMCPTRRDDPSYFPDVLRHRHDCNCTQDCNKGNLCNEAKMGSTKQCYGGDLHKDSKFKKEDCKFFNSDGCHSIKCVNLLNPDQQEAIPDIEKHCGKCPSPEKMYEKSMSKDHGFDCKCTECIGDMCNEEKDKGSIKQCFVGDEGSYKEEDCKFYNNDGCHTIECGDDDKPDKKRCGKCPPADEVENKFGSGCKCVECGEELCNKEVTVNQCYWGDDQKGYEAIDCKVPDNTACKKVKCRGDSCFINPETGKPSFKHHRDCGKCSAKENKGDCRCFTCKDKDLCNDAKRIGSSAFVLMLAMIGGDKLGCGSCSKPSAGCNCTNCEGELCNGKPKGSINQCYGGRFDKISGIYEKENCAFFNNNGCFTMECNSGRRYLSDHRKGCGKCPPPEKLDLDCKCEECSGELCNIVKNKGSIKQCYNGGLPDLSDKYEKKKCMFYENDGCHTIVCNGGMRVEDYEKRCGKCPEKLSRGCVCTDCNEDLCNPIENKGSINYCYGGNPNFVDTYEPELCTFLNNDGCRMIECRDRSDVFDSPGFYKSCGMCDDRWSIPIGWSQPNCKCSNCTSRGPIRQCYGGYEGDYIKEDCRVYNSDGCRTLICEDKSDRKSCGKCPPPEEVPAGCKCVECNEELCNKEIFVNQCYWGDDQRGYEAIDCKKPRNTACKTVKCRGETYNINPDTGKSVANNYRECGKCTKQENEGDCICSWCNDKDLCNGGMRIRSSSFVLMLAMIGGVITLLSMKLSKFFDIC